MFEDYIEIVSPGGLMNGISEKEYLTGRISILRNPIIGDLFYRLHLIERFGTGIQRINEAYDKSIIKPEFVIDENSITVKLPVVHHNKLTDEELVVFNMVKNYHLITVKEVCEQLTCGKSKATKLLNHLIELNIIEVVGKGKNTKYKRK